MARSCAKGAENGCHNCHNRHNKCFLAPTLSNIFATYKLPVKQVFSPLLILAIATIKGRKNSLVWQ